MQTLSRTETYKLKKTARKQTKDILAYLKTHTQNADFMVKTLGELENALKDCLPQEAFWNIQEGNRHLWHRLEIYKKRLLQARRAVNEQDYIALGVLAGQLRLEAEDIRAQWIRREEEIREMLGT